jgi:hypothetical protein
MNSNKILDLNIINTLKKIYRPRYIFVNFLSLIAYYFLIKYLIILQNKGMFFSLIPIYLIYILVITSSILFTISIYSIFNTRNKKTNISASLAGTLTAVGGGIVSSCGCSTSLVLLGLTSLGVSATELFGINNIISSIAIPIFALMILINTIIIIYYFNKLNNPLCILKDKSNRKKKM